MDSRLLQRAIRAYAAALNVADPIRLQFWDDRGLTMTQLRLMFLLVEHDGSTAGELAQAMRVRPATITGLTDRLVREALIERVADEDDRRLVRVLLLAEGRRVLRDIEHASRAYLERIFDRLGDARVEALSDLLEQFASSAADLQDEGEFRP
ncbi:MAG: MarR family transcriptional regulator [Chloroflexi bacterium]|nr:MarR family transcriptional regulator [Chloroflexota bacterium]